MKFQDLQHDKALLQELGRRLAQVRIDKNLTQEELSRKAGVGKRTLERLEAGETTQTRTLLRIFRQLDLLEMLEALLPEPSLRPRYAAKEGNLLPRRTKKKNQKHGNADEWKWGDET